jgi:hypothetical protein
MLRSPVAPSTKKMERWNSSVTATSGNGGVDVAIASTANFPLSWVPVPKTSFQVAPPFELDLAWLPIVHDAGDVSARENVPSHWKSPMPVSPSVTQ